MKNKVYVILLLVFLSCTNQSSKTNNGSIDATQKSTEKPAFEDTYTEVELTLEEQNILKKVKGEYYSLGQKTNTFLYQESCTYKSHDIGISRKLDDMGFWEIYWLNETLDILKVEEKNNQIRITTNDDFVFFFSKNNTANVWDLNISEYRDTTYITRTETVQDFDMIPCTDIPTILHKIPETWYGISEIDGKEVLYEPCESAPDGMSITETTIGFWSGSDPYNVKSMSKLLNKITITYERFDLSENHVVLSDIKGSVIKIRYEDGNNSKYVSKLAKDSYPIVKEDCND